LLAPTFGGTRDQTQALKVAAYSLTPAYVGSVLALSPVLPSLLQFIVLCYGLYVLYLGLPVVMRAPQDRALGYTATVVICTFLLGIVFALAAGAFGIFTHSAGLMGNSAAEQAGRAGAGCRPRSAMSSATHWDRRYSRQSGNHRSAVQPE
jgi:hypothetical protein